MQSLFSLDAVDGERVLTHRCVSECLSASVPVCRAVLQDEGALLVIDSGGKKEDERESSVLAVLGTNFTYLPRPPSLCLMPVHFLCSWLHVDLTESSS